MRRSFDWMARPYSLLETVLFGGSFQSVRTALIPALLGARHVLVLGEGDGRFVEALVRLNPSARVVVIDGSRSMLTRAAQRLSDSSHQVEFVESNAARWLRDGENGAHADAVVTTFFLDCLTKEEHAELFALLSAKLAPKALWLWADLVVPRHGWQALGARMLLRVLYTVFGLTTNITARRLVDPSAFFARYGWTVQHTSVAMGGILRSHTFVRNSPTVQESPRLATGGPRPVD